MTNSSVNKFPAINLEYPLNDKRNADLIYLLAYVFTILVTALAWSIWKFVTAILALKPQNIKLKVTKRLTEHYAARSRYRQQQNQLRMKAMKPEEKELNFEPQGEPKSKTQDDPKSKSIVESKSKPESKAKPKPDAKSKSKPDPKSKTKVAPKSKPKLEPKSKPKAKPQPKKKISLEMKKKNNNKAK